MKKYIYVVLVIVGLVLLYDLTYYRLGFYMDFRPDAPVTTSVRADTGQIYLDQGNGYESFEIRGVNMGSGEPGKWSTDFDIDEETYLRWFGQIQEMGANTVRIYTIQSEAFYNAFYEYNKENPEPLWLIHGVWVNDYVLNSHRDAYDPEFYDEFIKSCKMMVDVIHGERKIAARTVDAAGYGSYTKDISQWVIGYILGVEWEDVTVAYTNEKYQNDENYTTYHGEYMYTTGEATPFEAMLARVGDSVISYESDRYKEQRLVAFSNWPTTDPFEYPQAVTDFFMKCAKVDVEHIGTTSAFLSGQFASYHVYPYYPDYLDYVEDWAPYGITDIAEFITGEGELNTYKAYLSMLTDYHNMPVVISEFGVSTGRGMAQRDQNTGRNQGNMSEKEQGQALVDCYQDIMSVGCAGSCVFTWQDEWFKRTWNTMYAVNLERTPYWSDYQTNEQYFGLLSFDPGEEESICYVDGEVSDWDMEDLVAWDSGTALSFQYDEKFVYFLVQKKNLDLEDETLYIPIDTTPKSGSNYCENYELKFDREVDFLIVLDGMDNSRVQVQERYEALRANYSENVSGFDTYVAGNVPDRDSPLFVNIDMILQTATPLLYGDTTARAEVYETGKLTYGNANPSSEDYHSLADFICKGDYIEIKLPWQLLNFADPSQMTIHDDYYDGNYGVEYIHLDEMYMGLVAGSGQERTSLTSVRMTGWNNTVTYHERLKSSYYIMQELWNENEKGDEE